MARARNIKPGFFTNDLLAEIDPLGRLLFAGIWTIADRAGRLLDRPKKIKAEVLPFDSCDVDSLLGDLERNGFIVRYEVDSIRYLQIVNWDKHQNPHIKEAESSIPAPQKNSASTIQAPVNAQPLPERAGLIPDSLNLIPDSNTLSSSQANCDVLPTLKNGKAKFTKDAAEVIEFLNLKTGKHYRPVVVNLELVAARLAEGATVQDCKSVIAKKAREWAKDETMEQYLRPATLFNRTKFAQYVGELGAGND